MKFLSILLALISCRLSVKKRENKRPAAPGPRLQVESLEDRVVPTFGLVPYVPPVAPTPTLQATVVHNVTLPPATNHQVIQTATVHVPSPLVPSPAKPATNSTPKNGDSPKPTTATTKAPVTQPPASQNKSVLSQARDIAEKVELVTGAVDDILDEVKKGDITQWPKRLGDATHDAVEEVANLTGSLANLLDRNGQKSIANDLRQVGSLEWLRGTQKTAIRLSESVNKTVVRAFADSVGWLGTLESKEFAKFRNDLRNVLNNENLKKLADRVDAVDDIAEKATKWLGRLDYVANTWTDLKLLVAARNQDPKVMAQAFDGLVQTQAVEVARFGVTKSLSAAGGAIPVVGVAGAIAGDVYGNYLVDTHGNAIYKEHASGHVQKFAVENRATIVKALNLLAPMVEAIDKGI